jgi:hypothetical protein
MHVSRFTQEGSLLLDIIKKDGSWLRHLDRGTAANSFDFLDINLAAEGNYGAIKDVNFKDSKFKDAYGHLLNDCKSGSGYRVNACQKEVPEFNNALYAACQMTTHQGDNQPSFVPLDESMAFVKALCTIGTGASRQNIPGVDGELGGGEPNTMFGFLKEPEHQYLTFAAGSPMTMSFTSTVTDALETTDALEQRVRRCI